ncbi:MAG: cation:proton antiporter [Bacteroidetes bacterium]|nr:cation:proton antiporter [Bacteroidota bacterium]
MKTYKNIAFYILVMSAFAALIYFLVQSGKTLEEVRLQPGLKIQPEVSAWTDFKASMEHNVTHPLAILLLQIVTIIFTARTFGFIFNKIGQPTVIGEIIAGIFLGPSLLGAWFPEYSTFLFPKQSLGNLQFLSQVGLVLFMFVIGMELDLKTLKNKAHDAVIISHASIIIPYSLGMGLAYFIYLEFAPAGINFTSFSLFMGIAMSITAFPVLARIIQERNMTKTRLGAMAITCAAADDITAWCILAAVIAIVKAGSFISSLYTIAMAIGYVFIMLKLVRPFLKRMGEVYSNKESLSLNIVSAIFGILLISSFITEVIGIHALFGAFMAGVIMPPSINFRRIVIDKTESVSLGLLLPLFFVFTGLRTQIGLLNDAHLWGVCGLVVLVAIFGKFGGSMLAAKVIGQSWKDSLSIGALMNTRGLMELIVLNIGYDLGILKPEIFAMMVIMALVTTFMTGPALDLINRFFGKGLAETTGHLKQKFRLLLSFANPQSGKKLLRIANLITGHSKNMAEINTLHITPTADINQYQLAEFEKENFKPIRLEASKLGLKVGMSHRVSNDVSDEILKEANSGAYDLMLVGIGRSVFEGTLLGQFIGLTAHALNPDKLIGAITGKTPLFKSQGLDEHSANLISNSKIPVGIFIDHQFDQVERVLLPITSISDVFLLFYAKKMIRNSDVTVTIVDCSGIIEANTEIKEEIYGIENFAPNTLQMISEKEFETVSLSSYNMMLLSMDGYRFLSGRIQAAQENSPSLLLIRP